MHMPRAVGCFRAAGFRVEPYPTERFDLSHPFPSFRSWHLSLKRTQQGREGVDRPRYVPAHGQDRRAVSGAVVAFAHQLRQLGDVRRDPPRFPCV